VPVQRCILPYIVFPVRYKINLENSNNSIYKTVNGQFQYYVQ
jgi:hypothetical protein